MKKYYYLIILLLIVNLICPLKNVLAIDPKFRRPLNTILSPVFSYYYDNDTSSKVKNYYCGANTVYDKHQGTDFRAVVGTSIYAGANGGLYYRYDNCNTYGKWGSACGNGYGNHAKIDHEGNLNDGIGWVTIYAHMKQGTVVWLMSVLCGIKIGETGSSGNSTAPHFHFEVKKYSYPKNDPFSGSCSGSVSFWVNQNNGTPTIQCQ